MVLSRSTLAAIVTVSVLLTAAGCAKKKNPSIALDEPMKEKSAQFNAGDGSLASSGSVRALPPGAGNPWGTDGSGVPSPESGNNIIGATYGGDLTDMIDSGSGGIIQNANIDNIESAIEIADLDMVHFDYDKSEISPSWKGVLDEHSKWLVGHSTVHVQIEGHCDERGTDEYNIALGERRAQAVREYLVNQGVEPTRLSTISYGKMRPLSFDQTNDAHTLNRRGMFLVYTPDHSTETAANY